MNDLSKREKQMFMCMQWGILITVQHNHVYVDADPVRYPDGGWDPKSAPIEKYPLNKMLKDRGHDTIKMKTYGDNAFERAIEKVNEGFAKLDIPSLVKQYENGDYDSELIWGSDGGDEK